MDLPTNARGYSIGQLARQSGVHLETIRYYERIGVMPEPDRLPNGYRQYELKHLKRLNFIHKARDLGFNLKTIQQMLSMVDEHDLSCGEIHDITVEQLAQIDAKMSRLAKLSDVLKVMSEKCSCGEVPECPVIDALFDDA